MFVSLWTTGNEEVFHIYGKTLFRDDLSYIQKILGKFQGLIQNKKVDYIYYLYILLLLYYITMIFFLFFITTIISKIKELVK